MYTAISAVFGTTVGSTVAYLMSSNTQEFGRTEVIVCTSLGVFLGCVVGALSSIDEPFGTEDGVILPGIGVNVFGGSFMGVLTGVASWIAGGFVTRIASELMKYV
jgi:hypothetical protein